MSELKKFRIKIDERELEERLIAMGYENVPPELLHAMKRDLKKLVKHDLTLGRSIDRESTPEEASLLSAPSSTCVPAVVTRHKEEAGTALPRHPSRRVRSASRNVEIQVEMEPLHRSFDSNSSAASSNVTTSSEALVRAQLATLSRPIHWPRSCCAHDDDERDVPVRPSTSASRSKMSRCSSSPGVLASPKQRKQDTKGSKPKKNDPVSLYHSYKQEWDKFTVPGSDPRNDLRRQIRAKFL